jgi:hypothetical protein
MQNLWKQISATPLIWFILLSVATASVEHVFSAMKFVKSQLCNKMNDQW